jgi:hypothetical protein
VPIFEPVMQAVWANVAPKAALAPPSPEAKRQLACKSVDLDSGEMPTGGGRAVTECFRTDRNGQILDTQYRLVSREDAYVARERSYYGVGGYPYGDYDQRQAPYYQDQYGRYVPAARDPWRPPWQFFGQSGPWRDPRYQAQPQRDPYGREYQTQTPQYQTQTPRPPGYIGGYRRY